MYNYILTDLKKRGGFEIRLHFLFLLLPHNHILGEPIFILL